VTRTLAIRLDAARPAEPCTRVSTGAAVHFIKLRRSDGTLSFRRKQPERRFCCRDRSVGGK
jgi:hypothetical protein